MCVRRRRDGRWQIDFYYMQGGKRVRHREAAEGARNRSEALTLETRRKAELMNGVGVVKVAAPAFDAFADEFVNVYAVTNNKPSEVRSKRMILAMHLIPHFGATRLDRIGVQQIEEFKAGQVAKGLSPKTINNQLAVLGKLGAVAKEWGRVAAFPRIKLLDVPDPDFDFFDFDEAARLVNAALKDDPEWHPLILLGLRTGLRQGELLELRWDDIDLAKGLLRVRRSVWYGNVTTPKNGKTREVPLSDETRAMLRPLSSRFTGELVFPGKGGAHLTIGQCRKPLWRVCRRAGLRRVGWHVLRHTFASHLVMRGVPLKAVQELMGHATIEMTMRYAHLSPDVRRDAVALLDAPPARNSAGHDVVTMSAKMG